MGNITHWNHRVVKDGDSLSIREVFYDGDIPLSHGEAGAYEEINDDDPVGYDHMASLMKQHDQMGGALCKPVLVYPKDFYKAK